jgi:hypothetical protein
MKTILTTIVPIEFFEDKHIEFFIDMCCKESILSFSNYSLEMINIINDLNIKNVDLYKIQQINDESELLCFKIGTTLILSISVYDDYDDYFDLVNNFLMRKNRIVKKILFAKADNMFLNKFLNKINDYKIPFIKIHYCFSFISVFDPLFNENENNIHIKILSEPSLIDMDDMICTNIDSIKYTKKSIIDKKYLDDIIDVDISSQSNTYVTWASISSVTKGDYQVFRKNHLIITLLEITIQKIWNKCYFCNTLIDDELQKKSKRKYKRVNYVSLTDLSIGSYFALVDSKSCISATYSSRISKIFDAIVKTSQVADKIDELERKLNFLNSFINRNIHRENKNIQKISEILLFLIALPQIIQLFFPLPLIQNKFIGLSIVFFLIVIGIFIFSKIRRP